MKRHPSALLDEAHENIDHALLLLELAIKGLLHDRLVADERREAERLELAFDALLEQVRRPLAAIEETSMRLRREGVEPIPREFWKMVGIEAEAEGSES